MTLTVTVGWLVLIVLDLIVLIELLVRGKKTAYLRISIGGLYMKDAKGLKFGDRVEVIDEVKPIHMEVNKGDIGTFIGRDVFSSSDRGYIRVEFVDGLSQTCHPCQVRLVSKTLDTLLEGDVVVNKDGGERTVLGVCGRAYHMSLINQPEMAGNSFTARELKSWSFIVKGAEEEEETEMTVSQISKFIGKKVKIIEGGK